MDTVNNVKNTFSSWDSCMSKAYCKWPVIVGIVVGSLILLSVLFCIARCICCGAECACCCFHCCAGCCGGGRRDRGHKHLDSVPNTPYGREPQGGLPMYNAPYQSAPQPVYQQNAFPQTATFDSPSGKINEDSLPAMPSWENATSRQVEVVEEVKPGQGESHEMEKLNPLGYQASSPAMAPGFATSQPLRSPGGGSGPHSPYAAAAESDPFLRGQQATGVTHADSHSGYRGASPNPAQVGYGYANHGPGGMQNSQSFNSRNEYQQPTPDFYSHTGQGAAGGYGDQRPGGYDRQYSNQSRPGYDRQYSESSRQQPAPLSPQYSGSTAYDTYQGGYDANQGGYRSYSPAYGNQQGRKPINGSWKDV